MNEPEVYSCCGTTCDRQKSISEFEALRQRNRDLTKLACLLAGDWFYNNFETKTETDVEMVRIMKKVGCYCETEDEVILNLLNCVDVGDLKL